MGICFCIVYSHCMCQHLQMRLLSRILVPHRSRIPLKRFHFGDVNFCLQGRRKSFSRNQLRSVYRQCPVLGSIIITISPLVTAIRRNLLVGQLHAVEEFTQRRLYGQLLVPVFTNHIVCILLRVDLLKWDPSSYNSKQNLRCSSTFRRRTGPAVMTVITANTPHSRSSCVWRWTRFHAVYLIYRYEKVPQRTNVGKPKAQAIVVETISISSSSASASNCEIIN